MTKHSILLVGLFFASSSLVALGCSDDTTNNNTTSSASSSSGEASSSSSSGAGGSGGGGTMTPAEAYCAKVMANCKDANAQYSSEASCVNVAANFPAGMDGDMAGDTLGCRMYHAGAAATDAAAAMTHCPHAGPSGGAVCGTTCEAFCEVAVATCMTEWPDKTACMTACTAFASTGQSYSTADTSGNTVECRLYHLSVAATDSASAATHCPHTAAVSTVCK